MYAPRDLVRWLDERVPVSAVARVASHKTVPSHRLSVLYFFGGMTLFFFLVQVVTGILLMLYFQPSADTAFESVEFLMTTVPFGWLVRSLHSWSANLMIFFAVVHMATVFFTKAYRPPRELTWVTGVILLFVVLGFGFSGYLLPWNELSFFATKVGTDIAGVVPWVGEPIRRFLRGGDHVTGGTLSRFFGWHVAILPALATLLLGIHLALVQLQGMSVPPGREEESSRVRPIRFFPDFFLRELFAWTFALAVLATLAALFPWDLGNKADPFASAPSNIQPEWYFMFLYQVLKVIPGGAIAGIEYEAFPILLAMIGAVVLVLVPFLDHGAARRGRSPVFSTVGVVVIVFGTVMTAWGYRSLVPVYVVALTAAVVAVLIRVFRPGRTREGGES